jgi:hypothetical protein
MGVGNQFEEVLVTGEVFREQAEMEDAFALVVGAAVFFETGSLDEVKFAADERFDTFRLGGVIEIDGAKEIPVVGEGEGRHAEGHGAVHEAVDAAGSVQQAVVRMDVEMDKVLISGRHGRARQGAGGARARRKPENAANRLR